MSSSDDSGGRLYGLIAEFATPGALIAAADAAREAGFHKMDAYAPYPIEELTHALGHHRSRLPLLVLIGGVIGCATGLGLQWWVNNVVYPLNIGGRPLSSWPAFIPATFEMTVLGAALAAFFGFLALNGLPRLRHPVFDAPEFDLASRNRFFLCVRDASDHEAVARRLREAGAHRVVEVPA